MGRLPHCFLLLGVLAWVMTPGRSAGMSHTPRGLDTSIVEMEFRSFVEKLPESGWIELTVEVRNRLDESASWGFQFFAHKKNWGDGEVLRHSRRVTVGPSSVRTFRFQVPLYPSMESTYTQIPRLSVRITGPGTSLEEQYLFRNTRKSSPDVMRYVLISERGRSLAGGGTWQISDMEKKINAENLALSFLEFDPAQFPDSLNSLLGMDLLVLEKEEWETFGKQQIPVREWIVQGGHLVLLGAKPEEPDPVGLGSVRTVAPFRTLDEVTRGLRGMSSLKERILTPGTFYEGAWNLRDSFPDIKRPVGILMILVIGMAALLGPVNLRLAFRKRKSLQVLWSTPALSFGISVLTGAVILLGDGIGGEGARAQWVLILPDQRIELAWQEQVSRTGVLPLSSFTLEEGWWMRPVAANRADLTSEHEYSIQTGGRYAGDWFQNRTVQAHVLQRIRTTRARVELSHKDGRPHIRSTVEAPFTRIFYRDMEGTLWKAEKVSPGSSVPLFPMEPSEMNTAMNALSTRDDSLFPGKSLLDKRGWFYAEGASTDRMVDTLSSISWQDRPIWFLGPMTGETP